MSGSRARASHATKPASSATAAVMKPIVSAEEHAGHRAERADAAPRAERRVALLALGERRGEDGERGGGDDRRAEALQPARGDERALAPREA